MALRGGKITDEERAQRYAASKVAAEYAISQTITNLAKEEAPYFPDPLTIVYAEAFGRFTRDGAKYAAETELGILDMINTLAMFLIKFRAMRETKGGE